MNAIPEGSMFAALDDADELNPLVRSRVLGSFLSLGRRMPTFEQLRDTAAQMARNGLDPRDNSVLEVGLLLPIHEYEALANFVDALDVKTTGRKRRRYKR